MLTVRPTTVDPGRLNEREVGIGVIVTLVVIDVGLCKADPS